MGVGDQHQLAATALQRLEEEVRVGSQLDQMSHLPFQLDDRQIQLAGPEVQAVPVELALDALHQRKDPFPGPLLGLVVLASVAPGQIFAPEVIVEMQIQQGTVHVQQDGIYGVPVRHGSWVLSRWTAMITDQPVTTETACRRSQTSSTPA